MCGGGLVDIVSRYAKTFLRLQRYDKGLLTERAWPHHAVIFKTYSRLII